jgi:hypothetical protein
MSDAQPILALDVDGVLNALNAGEVPPGWERATVRGGLPIRYNPRHGEQLQKIAADTGAELVWCTIWEDLANEHIAPLTGLPWLPWVAMDESMATVISERHIKFSQAIPVGAVKARALAQYAAGRPACWLEDEPEAPAEFSSYPAPHLVVQVDPLAGLQDEHLAMAASWLASLRA